MRQIAGCSVQPGGDDFETLPADESVPKNADFAVRRQGDSVSPYISDGDTAFLASPLLSSLAIY